jgi:hypothetical protein
MLPVVLYGCETWSLTRREKHRPRVYENIWIEEGEVVGDWRRLHNEKIYKLYESPNILRVIKQRRMKWEGHVTRIGQMRNAHKILVGKSEEKNNSEDLGTDRKIILEWILGK